MKRIITSVLICFTGFAAQAQLAWTWANTFNGSTVQISGPKVAANPSGGYYIGGTFSGTKSFGSTTLTASGISDAFVAKCDNSGTILWAVRFGGGASSTVLGNNITVDINGDVFLCGNFTNYLIIDTNYVISQGQADIFIVKLNPSGVIMGYKQAGGYSTDDALGITSDPSGNIYLCGTFGFEIYFDNDSLSSYNGSDDVYVAKLNPALNFQWLKKAGGNSADGATAIRYSNNHLYVCGTVVGSAGGSSCTFGSNSITAVYADAFTAKYDLTGNNVWVKKGGGPYNDFCNDLDVDQFGNAYITGSCIGNASFPPFPLNAGNYLSVFVAKYDANGTCMFAKKASCTTQPVAGRGIATDPYGTSYVVGNFSSTTSFSPYNLVSSGGTDVFAARYNTQGVCTGVIKAGGTGDDLGTAACWLPTNENIVVGNFQSTAMFGTITLNSPAGNTYASFGARVPNSFTGIAELNNESLQWSVYPNPAVDFITINLEDISAGKIDHVLMYNSFGQVVWQANSNEIGTKIAIGTERLNNGIYTIQIITSEGILTQKVEVAK